MKQNPTTSQAAAALGRIKSEKKTQAARENGRKGGRPTHMERYGEFIRGWTEATGTDESHWAAHSNQLSDGERRKIEMRGYNAGVAEGHGYMAL